METVVTRALPSDAEDLCAMNREFNGDGDATPEHVLASLASGSEIVLIDRRVGEAVGFLCAQRLSSFCYAAASLEVREMYVRAGSRRMGVGRALMHALFSLCPGEDIHLLTGRDNCAAQAFYRALGFAPTGDVEFLRMP